MKRILKNFGASIIAALFVGAIVFIFWKVLKIIASLNTNLSTAIMAASTTIIVSVISILIAKNQETKAYIQKELREKKVPVYEHLISIMFKITYASKLGEAPMPESEVLRQMVDMTRNLVIWGSDEVVKAYVKFRTFANSNGDSTQMVFIVEELMAAIRKDLGHKNQGFNRGTILGLFVNDLDKTKIEK
jgi:hypothetical protein